MSIYRWSPHSDSGPAWVMAQKTPAEMSVTQYDDYPSKHHTTFNVPGTPMKAPWSNAFQAFMKGPTGLWYVNGADTRLRLIDPNSNKVQGSWSTGSWGFSAPRRFCRPPTEEPSGSATPKTTSSNGST